MAIDFSGLDEVTQDYAATNQGGTRNIQRKLIEADPNQPRRKFNAQSLDELAESIRVHGVIQPIVVRRLGEGKFMLVSGERRWRAAGIAGLDEIPAVVRDDLDAFAQVVENIQREDLSPAEIWRWISAQVESGESKGDLASKLGKSNAWVSAYCAVDKMPDAFKLALTQGLAADITALGQLYKLWKQHPAEVERALAAEEPVTRHSVSVLSEQLERASSIKPNEPPAENAPVVGAKQEPGQHEEAALGASGGQEPGLREKAAPGVNVDQSSGERRKVDAGALPARILVRYEAQSWALIYTRRRQTPDGEEVLLLNEGGMELYAPLCKLVLLSID